MAARSAPSICLACQARQALIGRRRPSLVKRRTLETLALTAPRKPEPGHTPKATTTAPSWGLHNEISRATDAILDSLIRQRDNRIRVLQRLSNPYPAIASHRPHVSKKTVPTKRPRASVTSPAPLQLPEAHAGPIPHSTFRANLAFSSHNDKAVRSVLRAQLLRCQSPRDIYKVVATALTLNKHTPRHIAALYEPMMRALYRCRDNVSDREVLSTLTAIQSRFDVYNLPFDRQLIMLALKFAARTRSLRKMRKYLRLLREADVGMSSNVFRTIIAKFSIGHRGLGEIRNGRWIRSELLQVATGFEDCAHLLPSQQYHLGVWLDRNDWQYLHGWIAVLARCKQSKLVWEEWEMWKRSPARLRPKRLASPGLEDMTTRLRGDYWFVEQMAYAGGLKEAWAILAETRLEFRTLRTRVKTRLLEGVEHCPPRLWDASVREALVRKYDADLGKIESAFGVRWIRTGAKGEAQGYHELVEDQEEVLERLGGDEWKLEEDYGYPWEVAPAIVPIGERGLHEAAEVE